MTERVLAISNHGIFIGGGEYSFLDLLCHLPTTWQALSLVPEEGEIASRLMGKGIETVTIPLPPLRPWHGLNVISSLMDLRKVCLEYRPALLYANGSRAAFYGGIIGRFLGVPMIWHCRVVHPDPYLDYILSRLSSKIVVNSSATASRFKPPFQVKTKVVYNGVNLDRLKQTPFTKPALLGDDWKVILVIARLSKWKRHDLALAAFERVAAIDPKAHLLCLGAKDTLDPGWWDQLQIMTRHSLFSERIHWLGQVEDIRPWLKSSSLLLLASDNEPFGRVLVEAMACGLPLVATKSGGVPEIVREGLDGLLVTPGNAQEMSDAIVKLLNNHTLSKRLSESGRNRAEEFRLEMHVNQMVHVFQETARNHAKRVEP